MLSTTIKMNAETFDLIYIFSQNPKFAQIPFGKCWCTETRRGDVNSIMYLSSTIKKTLSVSQFWIHVCAKLQLRLQGN
jgi:hypothetical protein